MVSTDSIKVNESIAPIISKAQIDEEKKLVRRIDLILMPTLWVLYLFSYADRTK